MFDINLSVRPPDTGLNRRLSMPNVLLELNPKSKILRITSSSHDNTEDAIVVLSVFCDNIMSVDDSFNHL